MARLASKEGCCNARNVAIERDASEVHVLMGFSALTYLAVNSSHLFDLFDKARKSTTTTGLRDGFFPSHDRFKSHESLPGCVVGSVLIVVDPPKKLSAC